MDFKVLTQICLGRQHFKLLDKFELNHKSLINQRFHYFGITTILLGLSGLFSNLSNLFFWGIAISVLATYFFRYGIYFSAIWITQIIVSWTVVRIAFVMPSIFWIFSILVGIGLLKIGHFYEGSKPRFTEEFQSLMIAPIWVFKKITGLPSRHINEENQT